MPILILCVCIYIYIIIIPVEAATSPPTRVFISMRTQVNIYFWLVTFFCKVKIVAHDDGGVSAVLQKLRKFNDGLLWIIIQKC